MNAQEITDSEWYSVSNQLNQVESSKNQVESGYLIGHFGEGKTGWANQVGFSVNKNLSPVWEVASLLPHRATRNPVRIVKSSTIKCNQSSNQVRRKKNPITINPTSPL
jgi:hypothetical protein